MPGSADWREPPCCAEWRGCGANSRLHTAKFLRLSTDLPIIVEIVDTIDKIEAFLPEVDSAVREGLATLE